MNELWAKVSANDRIVAGGAVVLAVGWLIGTLFGSDGLINWFSWGNAGLMALLALVAAVAVAVVIYLTVAPNVTINWPMPVVQIVMGLGVAALVLAVLAVLLNLTQRPILISGSTPVLVYLADIVLIAGGAIMAYGAYLEWNAKKA